MTQSTQDLTGSYTTELNLHNLAQDLSTGIHCAPKFVKWMKQQFPRSLPVITFYTSTSCLFSLLSTSISLANIFGHPVSFITVLWFNHSLTFSYISILSPENSYFFQIVPTTTCLFESFELICLSRQRLLKFYKHQFLFIVLISYCICKTSSKQKQSPHSYSS